MSRAARDAAPGARRTPGRRAPHGARAARALATALAAAAALACAGGARAGEAPADSALLRWLGASADSTEAWFGLSAARGDTAGLDSALAHALLHPGARPRRRLPVTLAPQAGFTRVDGPTYGGLLALGRAGERGGRLEGRLAYASGPNHWLGGAAWTRTVRRGERRWTLDLWAGRRTDGMDREFADVRLAQVRALLSGSDTRRYLRREGFTATLERAAPAWRASASFRDLAESPRAVTATWNLLDRVPVVTGNLPAASARVHELAYALGVRLPRVPVTLEAHHATSGDALGSDLEYRRTRLTAGADLSLGRAASLVPQVVYGRLSGAPAPQAAFYLGGSRTLRSVEGSSLGGTGLALARVDLIGTGDLLAALRIPHPAAFPVHGALFAGAGAVWGPDPYGGRTRPGLDWPHREEWRGEYGFSLMWRPGVPDPAGFLRMSIAWPAGRVHEGARLSVTWARGLDLLRPFED
uniref:Bacterial surface antigen (D15) domain-containing protein n=1 Tax=Eiseniibacteriota bacterium TaxID=2212470 RepID=A0A832MNN4_UNCEI